MVSFGENSNFRVNLMSASWENEAGICFYRFLVNEGAFDDLKTLIFGLIC